MRFEVRSDCRTHIWTTIAAAAAAATAAHLPATDTQRAGATSRKRRK